MSEVIGIDSYKGSNIEKAFSPTIGEVLKQKLDYNLEKGLIDKPLYEKAVVQLEQVIEKAGKGEGSKGGHIIGHTKSGKPIYKNKASHEYKNFSIEDHKDAQRTHEEQYVEHRDKRGHVNNQMHYDYHNAMSKHHDELAGDHMSTHQRATKEAHEKSLSDADKKIIADQKKKQQKYHLDMAEHHAAQIRSLEELKKKHNHPDIDQEIRMHSHRKDEHSIANRQLSSEIYSS